MKLDDPKGIYVVKKAKSFDLTFLCKQPQVNTMNNPKLGLFNLLTPMEIATEALFHHTKEEMKGGKPKSASSRLCSASE